MRSSRITRQIIRLVGATTVALVLVGGVAATPADAAHGIRQVTVNAHGV